MRERDARILSLLPLLRRIARRVNRLVPSSDLGDLMGDGSIGLIRAVDAYDSSRGPTLESYARRMILGTMLNGLRRMDHVSEKIRRTLRHAERERYTVAATAGSIPSNEELSLRHPGLARATLVAYRAIPLSLDAPLPLGEHLECDVSGDPGTIAAERDERAYLRALVDALPERQRRIMLAHYYGSASLRSIGRSMRISSQRASQLHISAIARLRKSVDAAPHRG